MFSETPVVHHVSTVCASLSLYADFAYTILTRDGRDCTGNTHLCEDVLAEEGITDLSPDAYAKGAELRVDLFVDTSSVGLPLRCVRALVYTACQRYYLACQGASIPARCLRSMLRMCLA
jgi:hypothetical protein